jgi:hypothetical protein
VQIRNSPGRLEAGVPGQREIGQEIRPFVVGGGLDGSPAQGDRSVEILDAVPGRTSGS